MATDIGINRSLSSTLRNLTLKKGIAVLEDEEHKKYSKELYNAVLLKLMGNVLPRINEVTGEDGGVLQVIIKRDGSQDNTIIQPAG